MASTWDKIKGLASSGNKAFESGYNAVVSPFDQPGDPVKVTPFTPGTVSGGAIAMKSLAALLAGHRAAANYEEKQRRDSINEQYKLAQIEQLKRKAAAPEDLKEYTLPGYTDAAGNHPTVKLNDKDAARYFHTAPTTHTGPNYRVKVTKKTLQRLGLTADADGTVDSRELTAATSLANAGTTDARLTRFFDRMYPMRERRLSVTERLAELTQTTRDREAIKNRVKALDDEANAAATNSISNHQTIASDMVKYLRDMRPASTPIVDRGTGQTTTLGELKKKYAGIMGVGLKMRIDKESQKAVPLTDNNGQPMYDLTGIETKAGNWVKRAQASLRARFIEQHQKRERAELSRLAQESMVYPDNIYNQNRGGGGGLLDALFGLRSMYGGGIPQPADSSEVDINQPAE